MSTRIVLAGGGTGGHVFPLVAVARSLQARGATVTFIGPEEFSLNELEANDVKVKRIVRAGKLRRYVSFKTVIDFIKLPVAFIQSITHIRAEQPHVILGKGGYGSISPVIVGWMFNVPVILHESDATPGLANRFLQRFARRVLLSFAEAESYFRKGKTIVVGNPVRTKYLKMKKSEAQALLKFETQRKTILVIGGSQGARSINSFIHDALPLLTKRYALIIATGVDNKKTFSDINFNNVLVRPFLNERELAAAFVLADAVVSRAGSGGIFEIAAFAKPAVIIPIRESTGGHQRTNARSYENLEAAVVLDESTVTEQTLTYAIESILSHPDITAHMQRQARKFARVDAADRVADILMEYAEKHAG
jgi:UDP-N-acetylglucosamine--N-acetylmuramyl-(pentapeptide) pyrophosphoryl-undecaprenol N-acetylglucosamine transferase